MLRLKRLHVFLLKTFTPLFLMTFCICLFVVLMQFLWRYVDEMVGKGLSVAVLGEMMSYAALMLVPMALPLSILLASLMTFGNLGERLELLAMKAAGISLLRIMRPIFILIVMISVGAYYFQNEAMPRIQVRFYTLLFSVRQKSPELDIPERSFYSAINGYNFYVDHKDFDTGILHDMMIYDMSEGFENAKIILADSGTLKMSEDKQYLVLRLRQGESFENLRSQKGLSNTNDMVPYRRETFADKEVFIPFDQNFNMIDGNYLQGQYVGKNATELQIAIDSITHDIDSVNTETANNLAKTTYRQVSKSALDSTTRISWRNRYEFDNNFAALTPKKQQKIIDAMHNSIESTLGEYKFRSAITKDQEKRLHRHETEWHKKFTLSIACLVFFFLGAPLGAIIRKGGLGMPVVTSVLLFIFYYIIDNVGLKMAHDGVWPAWQGMWLSTAVLLPLGAFLTYKASRDATIFHLETYTEAIKSFVKRFDKLCRNRLRKHHQTIERPQTHNNE